MAFGAGSGCPFWFGGGDIHLLMGVGVIVVVGVGGRRCTSGVSTIATCLKRREERRSGLACKEGMSI